MHFMAVIQAVVAPVVREHHHHFLWAALWVAYLWMWFICGEFLRMLVRAYNAKNDLTNPIESYRQFFKIYFVPLMVRFVFGCALFSMWRTSPGIFDKLLGLIGVSTSWTMPVIWPVALAFGFGSDWIVDSGMAKIPKLRDFIPSFTDVKKQVKEMNKTDAATAVADAGKTVSP